LLRLDHLSPQLAAHGVQIRGVSPDTPELVIYMRARDDLGLTLYADPELHAIGKLGLVQAAGQGFKTFRVLGIPIGVPWGPRRRLPVPTTLLIDEHGVVRWIGVATDYRLRGDDARILAAVKQAFGP
jgi:peroxiredoxin